MGGWSEFATSEFASRVIVPAAISALVVVTINACKDIRDRAALRHKALEDALADIRTKCDEVALKIEIHLRGVTEEGNLSESSVIITSRIKLIRSRIDGLKSSLIASDHSALLIALGDWNQVQTEDPFPLSRKADKLRVSAPELKARQLEHQKLVGLIERVIDDSRRRRFRL